MDIGQVLFCVFMDRDEVEVHKRAKKNEANAISSHFDRTSLVNKGFIIWDKTAKIVIYHLAGPSEKSRAGQISILPARVANHSAGFGSSSPLTELVI